VGKTRRLVRSIVGRSTKRLVAGLRADLALVDDAGSWPVVRATYRAA